MRETAKWADWLTDWLTDWLPWRSLDWPNQWSSQLKRCNLDKCMGHHLSIYGVRRRCMWNKHLRLHLTEGEVEGGEGGSGFMPDWLCLLSSDSGLPLQFHTMHVFAISHIMFASLCCSLINIEVAKLQVVVVAVAVFVVVVVVDGLPICWSCRAAAAPWRQNCVQAYNVYQHSTTHMSCLCLCLRCLLSVCQIPDSRSLPDPQLHILIAHCPCLCLCS